MPSAPLDTSVENASVPADQTSAALILHSAVIAAERPNAADAKNAEIAALRDALDEERQNRTLLRAAAEQARRSADCLRAFHETLLDVMVQPCFLLDRDAQIVRWNEAAAEWTGIPTVDAEGKKLYEVFLASVSTPLREAMRAAKNVYEAPAQPISLPVWRGTLPACVGMAGGEFSLLPLCRIPGCVESYLILLSPNLPEQSA